MKGHAIKCRGSTHSIIDQFKDFLKTSKPILILRKYKGENRKSSEKSLVIFNFVFFWEFFFTFKYIFLTQIWFGECN